MSSPSFSIYNASAGSGKTYTLVKSYLSILFADPTDDAYKKILAMTFTNKAVHEMKQRVMSTLHDFSKETVADKNKGLLEDIAHDLNVSEAFIQEKAKRIIKNIIHNYAYFGISTLDKFTQRIVRSFATDLQLPVSFETLLDTKGLLTEAVDSVISKVGNDPELTEFLLRFSLEKSNEDKSWDVSRLLIEMSEQLSKENSLDEIESLKDIDLSQFVTFKNFLTNEIADLRKKMAQEAQAIQTIIQQNGIEESAFSRGSFPKFLQTISDEKQHFQEIEPEKLFVAPELIKINKKSQEKVEGFLPEFVKHTKWINQFNQKRIFYTAFLQNLSSLSLIHEIYKEKERLQRERNIISIDRFNSIIFEHIKEQPAPFIYERLGERYRHFFIDEFQDTSEMQWENLIPLIDNSLAGQDMSGAKGSLLIVGDPKQSIYRWRGGKAEQFIGLSKADNPFSNPSKETIVLGTNYRSYDQIIQFNNEFFKYISCKLDHEDYKYIYENESSQKTNSKKGGYVEIQLLDMPKSNEEEETGADKYVKATLETIHKVIDKGFTYQDIVLLVQKNAQGAMLANHLTEHGVPVISSESLFLQNSTEVRLLIDVLYYLKNELNQEAKARFLYYLGKNRQKQLPVHDFVARGLQCVSEDALQQWLSTFGITIHFSQARKNDLYACVVYLAKMFIPEDQNYSYVQYFMDQAYNLSLEKQSSISDFLDYWEEKKEKLSIPAPENINAVRIMTIHKSKGLEFPVVIFPFAESDYNQLRDKVWVETKDFTEFNIPKAFVNLTKAVEHYGEKGSEIFYTKKQEFYLDKINVLYVALTRAEEQLYIISTSKQNNGGLRNNMNSYFIEFLRDKDQDSFTQTGREEGTVYSIGNPEKVSLPSKKEESLSTPPQLLKTILDSVSNDDIQIAKRQALMWNGEEKSAIEYGNLVHELMSRLENKNNIDQVIKEAEISGLLTVEGAQQMKLQMTQIVEHPELREFFEEGSTIYSEQMILQANKPNVKPDRIAVKNNKAYILDYKTGAPQEKYRKQVSDYAKTVEEMGYCVAKKSIVYIQEDELKVIHL